MIVFLRTRIHQLQDGYLMAAYKNEKSDKVLVNKQLSFFHCDNQNIPQSFFTLLCWLAIATNFRRIFAAINQIKKVQLAIIENSEFVWCGSNIISIQSIISHLAKRRKTANNIQISKRKLDLLILIIDQLRMNELITEVKRSYNEKEDTVVIFNGRVSPERLATVLWSGKINFVEQGFNESYYYSEIPPVSKRRWDNEFKLSNKGKVKSVKVGRPQSAILFLTSPYEYMFADKDFQGRSKDFQNQYEVLECFIRLCEEANYKSIVKFHPRTPKEAFLADHYRDNYEFEFTETKDDANSVIKQVDLVVLSSSSLAIDAAIHGKPCCNCVPAFYEHARVCVPTKNESELKKFMNSPYLLSNAAQRAITISNSMRRASAAIKEDRNIYSSLKRVLMGH